MTSTDGEELRREADPAASERRWRWPGAASTPMSATRPAHYVILEAGFAGGLAGVIALTRRRDREA